MPRLAALSLALLLVAAACNGEDEDSGDDSAATERTAEAPAADTDFCQVALELSRIEAPGRGADPEEFRAYFEDSLAAYETLAAEAPEEIADEVAETATLLKAAGDYYAEIGFDLDALQENPPEDGGPAPTPEQLEAMETVGLYFVEECGIAPDGSGG